MRSSNLFRRTNRFAGVVACLGLAAVVIGNAGCFSIGGKEPLLRVDGGSPPPVDSRRVQVSSMEEAQQKLSDAYARNDYLERQNAELRRDKEELKADLKKVKSEKEQYKDRYERAIGKD